MTYFQRFTCLTFLRSDKDPLYATSLRSHDYSVFIQPPSVHLATLLLRDLPRCLSDDLRRDRNPPPTMRFLTRLITPLSFALTTLIVGVVALPGSPPPPYAGHPGSGPNHPHAGHPPRDAPPGSFDFVIVGGKHNHERGSTKHHFAYHISVGGNAGLALAARLSENPSQRVLVLEAGPPPEVVGSYSTPGASQAVLGKSKALVSEHVPNS